MKKTIITALIAASLIGEATLNNAYGSSILYGSRIGGTISVSVDGKTWLTQEITEQQLASAAIGADGNRSLVLSLEMPGSHAPKFIKTSGQILSATLGYQPIGTIQRPNCPPCIAAIFATIVLIVAGVIIYELIHLCNTVLKDKPADNNNK